MKYDSTTDAFSGLVTSNKAAKVTRSAERIISSTYGVEYYFVEVKDESSGCSYIMETYGNDAVRLHTEVMKLKVGKSGTTV
jgi:hypothetical protein